MRIAQIRKMDISNGEGIGVSLFTQFCPFHCPGCHNTQSHDFTGGRVVDTDLILKQVFANPLLSGITLSGGDPLCQPEPCLVLAQAAHSRGLNVWCYTGYTLEKLLEEHDPARMALLENIDVLVDGPFLLAQKSLELKYCGSRNQRLIDMKKTLSSGSIVLWQDDLSSWDVL